MPSITKGSKVLVTGANGYIAMWAVRSLLERGFKVRGTVRNLDKGKHMTEYFGSLGYSDKLELVVVEDILKEGAFDEAVKGVDAIAHMASPVNENAGEPEDFIRPAVQGTVGILKSALKNGSQVQRIVITSSCGALQHQPVFKPIVFSERDWNEAAITDVKEKGNKAAPLIMYRASKTIAEREAWCIYEQNKSQIKWDMVTICPPWVFGPPLHEVKSASSWNASMQTWYNAVMGDSPKTKEGMSHSSAFVDVRDAAFAHVLSLEKEEAGGERILASSEGYNWQEWLDAVNSFSPSLLPSRKLNPGVPEITKIEGDPVYLVTYDKSKEARILGIKFRNKYETTRDILEYIAKRGW